MLIDLHVHEDLHSFCSSMSLTEAVQAAMEHGLDALCITDHNSMDIARDAAHWLPGAALPVFVGLEFTTRQGDMIAFGLPTVPGEALSAFDFTQLVKAAGGFCYAAHPFRAESLGASLAQVLGMHGLEVYNGGNTEEKNLKALAACRRLGLVPVAGSDAHNMEDVGKFAMYFPQALASVRELVEALKAGLGRPVRRLPDGGWEFMPV